MSLFGAVQIISISFCCFKDFRSVRAHNKRCFRDAAWSRVNVEDSLTHFVDDGTGQCGLLLTSGSHTDNRFFSCTVLTYRDKRT